ncbi:MAG: adenylate/guanylate cyclase domain-containing protein [Chloroflexi bacterium]|nr:adenylate/guanylate cyclase domain-containing protein [Chloroflexota bacterium]
MEPRIQYAKTSDGVSIAYAVTGQGAPLVLMPGQISHFQLLGQYPEWRRWFERLAEKRMIAQYDGRGSGLSERAITDFSVDALVLDLEAVVGAVGVERFALWAGGLLGTAAVAYAVRHPERLSHLILWAACVRGADFWSSSRTQAVRAVRETDWELYASAAIHLGGFRVSKRLEEFATALIREAITPDTLKAFMDASQGFDVVGLLPQVKCPTLVLHARQNPLLPIDVSRRIASEIPHARLVLVERPIPWIGDMEEGVLAAVDDFLGEQEKAAPAAARPEGGAVRTILFTDVEGSTALTQRLGDVKAREVLREHERIVREALKSHGGSEVKTMGDGFMASFASATGALECAIAIQRAFAEWNAAVGAHHDAPLHVRIGLNAGEPIAEEDPDGRGDLFGTAVILAARIAAQAQGGEILASNVVRELVAGKGFLFADRGDAILRGFEDPVRLFEVRWHDDA